MKRIATQKNGFWKRVGINIPFILLIALMVALFGGGLLFWFYAFASIFAFKSAMIFLIIFGAGTIAIGIGLGLIELYKKYYAFYNKKMGWIFPDAPQKEEKTVVNDGKKSFKDYLTLSNIAIAVLALGAVLTIISAGLGCINRDVWVEETSSFMRQYGYFDSVDHRQLNQVHATNDKITSIDFDLIEKNVAIVYSTDTSQNGKATFDYYVKFENQLTITRSNGVITVKENPAPEVGSTLKSLFFFVFDDFDVEKQIVLTLPQGTQIGESDEIKIESNNIIYVKTENSAQ